MAAVLELTATQVEVLTEVLAALSFAHAAPSATPSDAASAASAAASAQPPAATLGSEEVVLQELSLFLLAQLFSKEAQRADAVEYWPSADAAGGFGGGFGGGPGGGGGGFAGDSLLSPTRRSSSGGCG